VSAVDISTDGNSYLTPAAIEPPAGHAWQRFTALWRPDHGGKHELNSRARSGDGRCQPPSGARNAIHRVPFNVAWRRTCETLQALGKDVRGDFRLF
jgi:sulfane dehydrogenase subunit SoxC